MCGIHQQRSIMRALIALALCLQIAMCMASTQHDELLSAFMAMSHHSETENAWTNAAQKIAMPAQDARADHLVSSETCVADIHHVCVPDSFYDNTARSANMTLAELKSYMDAYEMKHGSKALFSYASHLVELDSSQEAAMLPSVGALGLGFDVSKTNDLTSATSPVFDLPLYDASVDNICGHRFKVPDFVKTNRQCAANAQSFFSDSENGMGMHMSLGAELSFSMGCFTGSLSLDLKLHGKNQGRRIFGSHFNDLNLARVELTDPARLPLHPVFEAALNALPETWESDPTAFHRFFSRWGTHFINKYTLGARLEVTTVTRQDLVGFGFSLDAAAKMSMDLGIMSLGGSMNMGLGVEMTIAARTSTTDYKMLGGDPALIALAQVAAGLLPEQRAQYPSTANLMRQWFDSAVGFPSAFQFAYRPLSTLAASYEKQRAMNFASMIYIAGHRPEEVVSVKPGEKKWGEFMSFPNSDCVDFKVSTSGSDEFRLRLAAAPGWPEKSYTFRSTPSEAMLLAGDEVLATSTNPRLRTAGEPGLFVDLFVCFREAVFYAGRGKSVLMQADISAKGWDVYYYGYDGFKNSDSVYIAGVNTFPLEQVVPNAPQPL